jgi:hypothetical protein
MKRVGASRAAIGQSRRDPHKKSVTTAIPPASFHHKQTRKRHVDASEADQPPGPYGDRRTC